MCRRRIGGGCSQPRRLFATGLGTRRPTGQLQRGLSAGDGGGRDERSGSRRRTDYVRRPTAALLLLVADVREALDKPDERGLGDQLRRRRLRGGEPWPSVGRRTAALGELRDGRPRSPSTVHGCRARHGAPKRTCAGGGHCRHRKRTDDASVVSLIVVVVVTRTVKHVKRVRSAVAEPRHRTVGRTRTGVDRRRRPGDADGQRQRPFLGQRRGRGGARQTAADRRQRFRVGGGVAPLRQRP